MSASQTMGGLGPQGHGREQHGIAEIIAAVQAYAPTANVDTLERAYAYCAKVHAGQQRMSGEPYLVHPCEVAFLLTRLKLDEASIVTALLHDTVEDTLATLEEIEGMFGAEVAALVDGVTKLSKIHFDTDMHKQAENFRKMLVAMAKDIRVVLVKLADRVHNMRTLYHLPAHKQQRIAQETLDIYAPLANRLGINLVKGELEDAAFSYLLPEDHNRIDRQVTELWAQREHYVAEVLKTLRETLTGQGIPCEMQGRPKHLYSIYKKMKQRDLPFDEVYDVIAFRVMVDSLGQCYEVLGHVHSMWRPIPGRFKDYIAMPKPNRYQSLHTSVIGPGGERIEIQIRTNEMNRIAEEGIAAHWQYKERGKVGQKSREQFAWLRQILEWQQDVPDPNEFLDTIKYDLFVDEVFVFTPRGEVISLKRGSTPVDFGFAIHTEVGTHCQGAKVNGRMVPLRHQLKNGDMVEVITNAQQKPSKDWLSFVVTGRAKQKIRALVRVEERARSKELGQEMLDKELRRHGMSLQRVLRDHSLQASLAQSKYSTVDSLLVALGYGRCTAGPVVERLIQKDPAAAPSPVVLSAEPTPVPRVSSGGVMVQGLDDVLVRFAKCCSPLPGDRIYGFITRGRGVTVHAHTCTRALDTDPERRIDVSWDKGANISRAVSLRITSTDRPGLLATISQAFTNSSVNISRANCRVITKDRAINTFEVIVRDAEQLRRVTSAITRLDGVLGVERL